VPRTICAHRSPSAPKSIWRSRARRDDLDEASLRSIRDEVGEFDRLVDALLLAARARLAPFAASRSVRITNAIASTPTIVGDPDILERVFVSLLHNGIKFSPPHGTVSLAAAQSAGPSNDALQHAFDRFWKDDAARGRSGTGLGLAIAKSANRRGRRIDQNSQRARRRRRDRNRHARFMAALRSPAEPRVPTARP
jgi:signal transduction histidine kinase